VVNRLDVSGGREELTTNQSSKSCHRGGGSVRTSPTDEWEVDGDKGVQVMKTRVCIRGMFRSDERRAKTRVWVGGRGVGVGVGWGVGGGGGGGGIEGGGLVGFSPAESPYVHSQSVVDRWSCRCCSLV
jgi:hypothetical protein